MVLYILFALPIPLALIGTLLFFMELFLSVAYHASLIAIWFFFCGLVVFGTYGLTYVLSLLATNKDKKISFKTFLPLLHCVVALMLVLAMNPLSEYLVGNQKYFGFKKSEFTVVEELDTHGGFHGDGSYYLILDCSDNRDKAMKILKDWKELPFSENLSLVMYGGEKDGKSYGYNLAEKAKIPKVENGYYYFKDRHSESKDSEDDTDLFNRSSFNFSIAIYDSDTDTMYYFEFDT